MQLRLVELLLQSLDLLLQQRVPLLVHLMDEEKLVLHRRGNGRTAPRGHVAVVVVVVGMMVVVVVAIAVACTHR